MIKKILFSFLFLVFGFVVLYLNLGKILDATSEPKKVDLIVCLGGGEYSNRVAKTKELYDSGYLDGSSIIFTGTQKIVGFDGVDVINPKGLKNTYEEVAYVKSYMKEQGLKSATFVTEAPHSFRILLFGAIFGKSGYEFSVVGSKYDWDASNYYKHHHMRAYAFSEVSKIVYNIFLYGILDSLGLKDWFESHFASEVRDAKRSVGRYIK